MIIYQVLFKFFFNWIIWIENCFYFIDSDNEDIFELMDLDVFDDEVEEEGVIDEEDNRWYFIWIIEYYVVSCVGFYKII